MVPQQQALEKDTAYTRALERGVPPGASDNSGTLCRYYAPEALAANRNRARTKTPPRSMDTSLHQIGRTAVSYVPSVVKDVIGQGQRTIRAVAQFAHEGHEIARKEDPIRTAIIDAPMWVAGRVLAGAGTAVNTGTRFVETQTRRGLRDRLGLSKDAAQDVGDVAGFLAGFAIPMGGHAKAGRAVSGITAETA